MPQEQEMPLSEPETLDTLDWKALLEGCPSEGRLERIVRRLSDERRELLERVCLDPGGGLLGDHWSRSEDPDRVQELTLLNIRVARQLVNDDTRLAEFGDNLLVDFDLSERNLPVGSRFQVGEAQLEVTPKPHLGCAKFARRFGTKALRAVSHPQLRALHLRGVHARVIVAGEIHLGDPIRKLAPGP